MEGFAVEGRAVALIGHTSFLARRTSSMFLLRPRARSAGLLLSESGHWRRLNYAAFTLAIANGFATLTLNGIVRDPIADNMPRGKVTEGRADIDAVDVYVNGVLCEEAIAVDGQDDGPGAFWCTIPKHRDFYSQDRT